MYCYNKKAILKILIVFNINMIDKFNILNLIKESFINVLENKKPYSLKEEFIGPNSILESIEIVQLISHIEENLEKEGVTGFDLFECIYEFEALSFEKLATLIDEQINTK